MKQRLGIVIALFCLSPAIFAQQKAEKNAREDNASFTFTESQLNEDDDVAQSASAFVSSNNDVYLSNVGYLFSRCVFASGAIIRSTAIRILMVFCSMM